MNIIRISAAVCLLWAGVLGQADSYALRGKVTDSKGNAVAGAEVTVTAESGGEKLTAKTDAEGTYLFPNIHGTFSVVALVAVNGRLKSSELVNVTVRLQSSPTVADLVIEDHTVMRETVTVSAGTDQSIDEVAKTVNIIDGQEMRDRADFTLVDTLRSVPGFRVQQLGGFGKTASIKMRGLRNQDTAVLIDGIRFRDAASITGDATPFLSDFTLTSVERIEVLRGSGSSLYGTNAIGGVIDFQTPEPQPGWHGQVSGAAGGLGLGRFRGNLSRGLTSGKFGINAGLSRTVYTKGIDGDDDARNTNFQARADAKPFAGTLISGRIFFSDARVRLNVNPDVLGTPPANTATIIEARPNFNFTPDANDPDSMQRSRFLNGQIAVTQIVSDKLHLNGHYQGLATRRRNDDGPLGPGFQGPYTSIYYGRIHTGNINLTWTPITGNSLKAGYEFEKETFRNDGSTPTVGSAFYNRAGQQSNTFYLQELAGLLNGDLQLAGGVRLQTFDLDTPSFSSPNAPYVNLTLSDPPRSYTFDGAASYFIRRSGTKLRAHAGNGYRIPSLYERFGTYFFANAFFPLGNPALKPERSLGVDAGLEQYFARERVKVSATYFYTQIKDEITFLPTDDFGAPSYYNFDRHFSRGAEFSVDLKPVSSTNVFVSYTFTNSDVRNFRRPTFTSLASLDRQAFGIPDHQFTLVATQRFRRFWVNFDFLASSAYLAPVVNSTTFATYTYRFGGNRRGDLTAGYNFHWKKDRLNMRIFGTIENVFNNEYYENGFRTPGSNARVGLAFAF